MIKFNGFTRAGKRLNGRIIFKEQIVNRNFRWIALAILIMLFAAALAACQPATQVVESTSPTLEPTLDPALSQALTLGTQAAPASITLEGAKTTASGLQYLEEVAGTGRSPQPGDLVKMDFVLSLPDGTEFANSQTNGAPITAVFGREELLPGWEEGLALMKAGGKAKLAVPPELAFGEQGYGGIPPNSQIILDVNLLSVEEPPKPSNVAAKDLITTASGLQYYDIEVGTGAEAISNTVVTTPYTIWVKGDTADEYIVSSTDGQPISFSVGKGDTVFPGWEEGVQGMKVGGKRQLVIPPELALGAQGANRIPANATLIMEIGLTDVREPVKMSVVDPKDYTTTASGLEYYDVTKGTGAEVKAGDNVTVHYTGWLEDGTQFDSSVDRGEPFTFTLGQNSVIPGWEEGLIGMKVGGKRQLRIPAALAYGTQGSGPIPPDATLIFDIELLDIPQQ
jgi:FKBP-type peptidyl-prolyl cis-trans isomerase